MEQAFKSNTVIDKLYWPGLNDIQGFETTSKHFIFNQIVWEVFTQCSLIIARELRMSDKSSMLSSTE